MSLFRTIALGAQRAINATGVLEAIERRMLANAPADMPPPILILGCPRSGTTLLYELLVAHYRCAYPANIAALLYRSPVIATRLGLSVSGRHQPKYQSDTGYISGLLAPSEAGALMRHWFTGQAPIAAVDRQRFSAIARQLCRVMGGPLVLKNLYLDNALDLVVASLPNSVVLRIKRDPRFIAQSIIEVRRKELGDERAWWGPKPVGFESVAERDSIQQVAWQIAEIEGAIDRLAARPGFAGRIHTCDYSMLCRSTLATIEQFAHFYHALSGVTLEALLPVPSSFPASERITLPEDRWRVLESAIAERMPAAGQA